ncbi:MAG TPA: type II secretion system protein [Candidatus Paceibacterota bacterium]|nr:type II secretion system protein [Candidatus Paceibacterota bacterium]
MRPRGFTLIELLVTVFLIGLLSAIVLSSLSGAKSRGNDTGVKSEVGTIATQAVLYYGLANQYQNFTTGNTSCDDPGGTSTTVFYDAASPVDTPIRNAITNLRQDAKGGSGGVVCRSKQQQFVIMAQLSSGNWYCADATATTTLLGPVELSSKPSGYTCQ